MTNEDLTPTVLKDTTRDYLRGSVDRNALIDALMTACNAALSGDFAFARERGLTEALANVRGLERDVGGALALARDVVEALANVRGLDVGASVLARDVVEALANPRGLGPDGAAGLDAARELWYVLDISNLPADRRDSNAYLYNWVGSIIFALVAVGDEIPKGPTIVDPNDAPPGLEPRLLGVSYILTAAPGGHRYRTEAWNLVDGETVVIVSDNGYTSLMNASETIAEAIDRRWGGGGRPIIIEDWGNKLTDGIGVKQRFGLSDRQGGFPGGIDLNELGARGLVLPGLGTQEWPPADESENMPDHVTQDELSPLENEPVRVRELRFVDHLDEPEQDRQARRAIEQMLSALNELLHGESAHLKLPDQKQGEVLQRTLNDFYRLEGELPVPATDGTLMSAAQLVKRYSEPSGVPDLTESIDELVSDRPAGDATGINEPLEHVLQLAGDAAQQSVDEAAEGKSTARRVVDALRGDTIAASRAVFRASLAGIIGTGLALAADGLGFLATEHAYVVALIQWIGAATCLRSMSNDTGP